MINWKRSHLALVFLVLGMSFASTFDLKQLYNDGAYWAFDLATNSTWHIERQFQRYSTLLPQTAAVIAAKLGGSVWLITWLFCLGYAMYPLAALIPLIVWLKRRASLELLQLVSAVFLLSVVPHLTFSVAVTSEAIVLYWFLLCYVLATAKPSPWIISFWVIPLCFTYEVSLMFFPLTAYLLWREGQRHWSLYLPLLIGLGFSSYMLFTRIIPVNSHMHYFTSFKECLRNPFLYSPAGLLIIFLEPHVRLKKLALTGLALSCACILYYLGQQQDRYMWAVTYFNRVWGIPMACAVIFLCYEYLKRFKSFSGFAAATMFILALPPTYLEARLNYSQTKIHHKLSTLVANPGCHVLNKEAWERFEDGAYVPVWSLPMMSMLYGDSFKVRSIVYTDIYNDKGEIIPNDFCTPKDYEIRIWHLFGYTLIPIWGRFDFTEIYGSKL